MTAIMTAIITNIHAADVAHDVAHIVAANAGLFQMANNAIAKLQALLFAIAALAGVGTIIWVAAVTKFSIPKMLAAFIGAGLLLFAVHHLTTSSGVVDKTSKELGGILLPPGIG